MSQVPTNHFSKHTCQNYKQRHINKPVSSNISPKEDKSMFKCWKRIWYANSTKSQKDFEDQYKKITTTHN